MNRPAKHWLCVEQISGALIRQSVETKSEALVGHGDEKNSTGMKTPQMQSRKQRVGKYIKIEKENCYGKQNTVSNSRRTAGSSRNQ